MTRRCHILGIEGHYAWKRELNCFQGQSLPDALYPSNSLEISYGGNGSGSESGTGEGIRIRFGALEALRG